eukprot:10307149-Lingulodinium_polyedra.AAC.1
MKTSLAKWPKWHTRTESQRQLRPRPNKCSIVLGRSCLDCTTLGNAENTKTQQQELTRATTRTQMPLNTLNAT